jgi:integrase
VRRSFVRNTFDMPKTISSQTGVPIAPQVADALFKWKQRSRFKRPDDLAFASPFRGGKLPYDPSGVRKDHLTQAGVDIGFGIVSGITVDTLGWHTFRHSYRTWLDTTGAPITVQQHLMRHAVPLMTLH